MSNHERIHFPDSWIDPISAGYGTFLTREKFLEGRNPEIENSVRIAIENGYRHIDTAQAYYNEEYVGIAIENCGLAREELFITSKIDPGRNSRDGAINGLNQSLEALNLNYLDLFLIHWPGKGRPLETFGGLIELMEKGRCRHIGVSNFEIRHLEQLYEVHHRYPEVNQIEFHPFLFSEDLMDLVRFCRDHNIQVEGYCPLVHGHSSVRTNPIFRELESEYQHSIYQILLKWCMQHRVRPIVGSLNRDHIRENTLTYDFELSQETMDRIDNIGDGEFRVSRDWEMDPTEVGDLNS